MNLFSYVVTPGLPAAAGLNGRREIRIIFAELQKARAALSEHLADLGLRDKRFAIKGGIGVHLKASPCC